MGVKKNNAFLFNWYTAANANPVQPNIAKSGITDGVMTGTNAIYSDVQDLFNFDNAGLVITYTGTPTGTLEIYCANLYSDTFYPLTIALTQPAGAAGGYLVSLNQLPWRFFYVKYTNASGSGILNISIASKDMN